VFFFVTFFGQPVTFFEKVPLTILEKVPKTIALFNAQI